jgi:hypothetical protein
VSNKFLYIAIALFLAASLGFLIQLNQLQLDQPQADPENINRLSQASLARAYFEGQKDALTGHVHIRFDTNNSVWLWAANPQVVQAQATNQTPKISK